MITLEHGYTFDPPVTVVNGERIEVSYDAGKPYAYKVLNVSGDVRQTGNVYRRTETANDD